MNYIIGSISTGTLRPADLLPEFAAALELLAGQARRKSHYRSLLRRATAATPRDPDAVLEDLFDALNEFAPPYFYFGAHPGDGADFGFWLSDDALQEFIGRRVSDLAEVPDSYSGEVLLTNDHGNLSLYFSRGGKLEEIWAVV